MGPLTFVPATMTKNWSTFRDVTDTNVVLSSKLECSGYCLPVFTEPLNKGRVTIGISKHDRQKW